MAAEAIVQFANRTFHHAELLTDHDPVAWHGAKMDKLFNRMSGSFAVVWDDDDLYRRDRIARLVRPMIEDSKLLCVGTSLVYYIDERIHKAYLYDNAKMPKSMFWMAAPAYRREAYELYGPWENLKCGADLKFLRKIPRSQVLDLRDPMLMVCRIHSANAAGKQPHPPAWEEVLWEQVPKLF